MLDNINKHIRMKSTLNQFQNTSEVIEWFKNLKQKPKSSFLKFDIQEFYPSITKDLLLKALEYAKSFVHIDENTIKVIMHSRKCLLFEGKNIWIK